MILAALPGYSEKITVKRVLEKDGIHGCTSDCDAIELLEFLDLALDAFAVFASAGGV